MEVVKNPPANAGDTRDLTGSGRSLGEGNGNPLQNSCLGNPMDRGAWWAAVHGVARVGHDCATENAHTVIRKGERFCPEFPVIYHGELCGILCVG